MNKKPLLLGFFAALAFCLPCTAQRASTGPPVASQQAQRPQDANLPEAGSALPLLSTIGAGVLLGGLVEPRSPEAARPTVGGRGGLGGQPVAGAAARQIDDNQSDNCGDPVFCEVERSLRAAALLRSEWDTSGVLTKRRKRGANVLLSRAAF